ncbi:hypothetical protein [Actinomadura fibrosa]|uniref:Lipoprotein n=1 Tax=Actinomadura fibrosa TaxID=111802 RepID=A0ABW2XH15_9ACTN|nr:hypothetical protein [Actinomadura fibrosa]
MVRSLLVVPALLLAMTMLTSCGGDDGRTPSSGIGAPVTPAGQSAAASAPSGSASGAAACPTEQTKKFAKTRFAADAGLSFGAFHRYIWKPYQAGDFQQGADGRKTALVKAAAAGAFAANRLNAARKLINADPKLCKALKQPADAVWSRLTALAKKLKSGQVDPGELGSLSGAIDGLKSTAKDQTGTDIKEKSPNLGG